MVRLRSARAANDSCRTPSMRYSQMVSGRFDYSLYGISNGSDFAVVRVVLRPIAACLLA
jgi:hypothetical protein